VRIEAPEEASSKEGTRMIKIELTIPESQMGMLADLIADRMAAKSQVADGKPLTVTQAATRLGISESTVVRRVKAGTFPTLQGVGRTLIPAAFIAEMLEGKHQMKDAQ
jgi:excisionase family DNA binding protein